MRNPPRNAFKFLISRADAQRDAGKFAAAAALYDEALGVRPDHAGAHIQAGHMYKEIGDLAVAETHYRTAQALRPDDADLALQMGHFLKVAGRPLDAIAAYRDAVRLRPEWDVADRELTHMQEWLERGERLPPPPTARPDAEGAHPPLHPAEIARLVPELAPRRGDQLLHRHGEEISVRRFGRSEPGYWGTRRTVRGIEAIRGFCISERAVLAADVFLNGMRIHRASIAGGFPLAAERDPDRVKKYVFNMWIDFSPFPRGLHALEVRFQVADDGQRSFHDHIVIAEPEPESAWPDSDFLIDPDPRDARPLEDQVRTRPSMVRPAARTLFPDGVRSLLVMRMDQLGDMVASIPAMYRLREMFPEATLVGLFTPANEGLARSLDLFDDIVVASFPDVKEERRRVMPLVEQEALRLRLEPFAFDIAIDLAQSGGSRDLLRLAGAKFTHATGGDWPWLTSEFSLNTRDRWTRHDRTPHSTKVLALVESLGSLANSKAPVIRRADLGRDRLTRLGIAGDQRFAVIHTGARIGFSQWPHYGRLAGELLERSDLKVIMINDGPHIRAALPETLRADPRLIVHDGQLPFDDFDALLSFAEVVVGNDSGPKHLAALRGTPVVTLFSARINWTEWGQENVGTIISRKVPCAGCAILHDPEECGRGFICVTDIKVEEVRDAALALIGTREETTA